MKKSETINQFINFFWTILCFLPILFYWPGKGYTWLIVFIVAGLIWGLLPNKLLRYFQLSKRARFYESTGVKFIRSYVQNGTYANRIASKPGTAPKVIANRTAARKYLNAINLYERFHLACMVFFILTFIHALVNGQYVISLLIFISNIIYNLAPILLQQYNKLRVMRVLK
ncbi:glycosyl-4,4'-diaponeurosporenoate acyltransferase CrtO family protein [Mucilaginibacter agri]|uniref:Glycosyl-4,4'-diaponeurosporenoate acyltransferase n=1 Tax=Mucilaginibacter agri TaxID=2695265 RepID=A0A965ZGA7_9SPHI|nr:hypothetical protein [Mucilaginibacter agri]NCD70130.1 hypothetical protein [Mucilaginibacter agri]